MNRSWNLLLQRININPVLKKNVIFFLCLFFTLYTNSVCAQTKFQINYGGSGADEAYSVQQTNDYGSIIVGTTASFGGNNKIYILRINQNGDTLWTSVLGRSDGINRGYHIDTTNDGGFIVTGSSFAIGPDQGGIFLAKLAGNGTLQWTQTFGKSGDTGKDVVQTNDGGYILSGTAYNDTTLQNVFLCKTDNLGNEIWKKTLGGNNNDYGNSVQETIDGYVVGGTTTSYGADSGDVYLIKVDPLGNEQWNKTFGNSGYNQGYSIEQTSDNGYIIVGSTGQVTSNSNLFVVKTDANGDSLWTKEFGGSGIEEGYYVKQCINGTFMICGRTTSFGFGSNDGFVLNIDLNGNSLWSKTYGGTGSDKLFGFYESNGNGYVLAGVSHFGASDEMFLIKTDTLGNSGCHESDFSWNQFYRSRITTTHTTQTGSAGNTIGGNPNITTVTKGGVITNECFTASIHESDFTDEISVYPNPSDGDFSLIMKSPNSGKYNIKIYNILGGLVYENEFLGEQVHLNLPQGLYFVNLNNGNSHFDSKIIIR